MPYWHTQGGFLMPYWHTHRVDSWCLTNIHTGWIPDAVLTYTQGGFLMPYWHTHRVDSRCLTDIHRVDSLRFTDMHILFDKILLFARKCTKMKENWLGVAGGGTCLLNPLPMLSLQDYLYNLVWYDKDFLVVHFQYIDSMVSFLIHWLHHWLMTFRIGLCIVNVHWYANSDRFLIFTFGTCTFMDP